MTIGIDASNLVVGGGRKHIIELVNSFKPSFHSIKKIVVFGNASNLPLINDVPWVKKVYINELSKGVLRRNQWIAFSLKDCVRKHGVNLLLVPGGIFTCGFQPTVVMSQNLLPFELIELRRYGLTKSMFRLLFLRFIYAYSFKRAAGVIFLTDYARKIVLKSVTGIKGRITVIPHGVSIGFFHAPRDQFPIDSYSKKKPFRLLYISTVVIYKNQVELLNAVAELRMTTGWQIVLEFVGASDSIGLKRFKKSLNQFDDSGEWAFYHGWQPESELSKFLKRADLGLYASGCENMPITLLMKMAAGLPIVSSYLGPMPEILGEGCVQFNPRDVSDICVRLKEIIESPEKRMEIAKKSFDMSKKYDWENCSHETFGFLEDVLFKK